MERWRWREGEGKWDLGDAGGRGVAISTTQRVFQIYLLWRMMVDWQAVRTFSLTRRGVVFVLAASKFGCSSKTLKDCRYQASTVHSLDVSALSVAAVNVVAGAAAVAVK
jgi:hypothetical protein